MLRETDLAKYVRKTFLVGTVLMKELTGFRSEGGSSSVSGEVRSCYSFAGPGHMGPSESGLCNLNNDSVTTNT